MRTKVKTRAGVRRDFQDRGEPISKWAVVNGFNPNSVFMVLSGHSKCIRGEAHRISVALGLKRPAGTS
jgi:gp16 family phage-associated protein